MRADVKFTYREYAALPEAGPKYQLVEGELLLSPSPNYFHQVLIAHLFSALYNFVKHEKLGQVLTGPIDVILSDENTYVPDIVYVSNARKQIIAPEGLRGAPDLVVEVLSPSNRNLDLGVKRVGYARYGVDEYWIVDPEAKVVDVFRFEEDTNRPVGKVGIKGTVTTKLLPGFALSVKEVFESP